MGKIKTHKASAKRFSVTGTGKVKLNHCHHRHNLGLKTAKRKRHLRTGAYLSEAMAANIKALIQKLLTKRILGGNRKWQELRAL